jgi:NADPH-dependent 2,4-dienoyl-CoA reductase/sulfur reductase-like enzyme
MLECDVAVVGAGPAGMSAARAAADCGARVTVLDEYPRPGGQYFKRAAPAFALAPTQLSREHDRGEARRAAIDDPLITVLSATIVWGIFDDDTVMLYRDGRSEVLRARAIVLATGAFDRPVAFAGWTLPGVMSAGGAQTLAKTQWVKPGHRVLLAGAGPFLMPVAQQLVRAGCEIVAILEATRRSQWLAHAPALWGQWPRFAEARDYLRTLRRAGIPIRTGHKIVAAEGDGRVEAARIAKVDADWRAVPGSEQTLAVDAIAVGYGFLPAIELAASLDCALRWDAEGLAWFVECGHDMATSRPGIYAAGEITGIAGAAPAIEEGIIAGIGAAAHAGSIGGPEADRRRRQPLARRARLDRFARMINTLFRPRPGLWEGAGGATVVCRCEEVMASEVRAAVAAGCATPKEVKDLTRAGMGLCQGRSCRALITTLIAEETGVDPGGIPFPRVRPPIKPVPAGALAAMTLPGDDAQAGDEVDA